MQEWQLAKDQILSASSLSAEQRVWSGTDWTDHSQQSIVVVWGPPEEMEMVIKRSRWGLHVCKISRPLDHPNPLIALKFIFTDECPCLHKWALYDHMNCHKLRVWHPSSVIYSWIEFIKN